MIPKDQKHTQCWSNIIGPFATKFLVEGVTQFNKKHRFNRCVITAILNNSFGNQWTFDATMLSSSFSPVFQQVFPTTLKYVKFALVILEILTCWAAHGSVVPSAIWVTHFMEVSFPVVVAITRVVRPWTGNVWSRVGIDEMWVEISRRRIAADSHTRCGEIPGAVRATRGVGYWVPGL